ncbi:S-GDH family dehydrogenase, PQQ-dependent [Leptotrichia wadei]|uniref:S-GDH family dehydrogenase, PQQ-dependent n=1 Tax=Leptotrichia wadei TaxID=157687 RepID=A0A510K9J8_9FUSO|nr:S-GDH family dehydrogenase, PQQ-dependent [Leptotrichia wadei]
MIICICKRWENKGLTKFIANNFIRNRALYIVSLNADGKNIQRDVIKYFKTNNRYRIVLVSPDKKNYIATDITINVIGAYGKSTTEIARIYYSF